MLVRVIFSCRRSWRTHVWVLWNRAAFFPPSVIWKASHPQASIMCLATGFTVTISSWHWNISCLFNLASFPSQKCFWVHNWKGSQTISLLEGAMNLTVLVINSVIKARKFNTSAMKSFLHYYWVCEHWTVAHLTTKWLWGIPFLLLQIGSADMDV